MKQKSPSSSRNWWFLFRVRGLEVRARGSGLDKPLLEDATFLSKRDAMALFERLRAQYDASDRKRKELDFLARWVRDEPPSLEFDTFLAVRRAAAEAEGAVKARMASAMERAREVSSLVALAVLVRTRFHQAPGLVHQIHGVPRVIVAIDPSDDWGFHGFQNIGPHAPIAPTGAIKLSRARLGQIVQRWRFKELYSVIVPTAARLRTPMRECVRDACVQLAEALHGPTVASRMLGSMISIEILLSEGRTKHALIASRLRALIGDCLYGIFDGKDVLQARHQYVHRGKGVSEEHELSPIQLALASLLGTASIAWRFSSKAQFLEYLDFIAASDRMWAQWTKTQKQTMRRLRIHRRFDDLNKRMTLDPRELFDWR